MMVNADWTCEEAYAENVRVFASDPSLSTSDPTLPFPRWFGLKRLEQYHTDFLAGDKYVLMTAIRICTNHDLPLPEWAAYAFIAAYDTVTNARAKTWDEVFGSPYPKGTHLHAVRKKRTLRFAVFNRVHDILQQKQLPIDGNLFETVGKEFNIGKTLAAEYYYSVKYYFPDSHTSAKNKNIAEIQNNPK